MVVARPAGLDSFASIGAYGLVYLLGIPTAMFIARAVGPEGKGLLTLVSTVVAQVGLISLGVESALVHYGGRRTAPLAELAKASKGLSFALGSLGALIAAVLILVLSDRSTPDSLRILMMLSALSIPVLLPIGYIQGLMVAQGRVIEVALLSALLAASGFASAIAVYLLGLGVSGLLLLNLVSVAILGGIFFRLAQRYRILRYVPMTKEDVRALRGRLLRFGLRGHAGTLFQGLNSRLDVLLVAAWLSPSELGVYSVAVTSAETLLLVPTFIGSIIFQRAASLLPEESKRFTGVATRLTAAFLMLMMIIWVLLADPIITVLFGEAFLRAIHPLLVLLPGIWLLGLWRNITNDLVGRGHPEAKTISAGLALMTSVFVGLLLIPRLELLGAALMSAISYAVAFLVILVIYSRNTQVRWRDVFLVRSSDFVTLRQSVSMALRYVRRDPSGSA